MYVTSRFTSYAVGSDKYAVCNALSGEVVVLNRAGLELLESFRSGETPVGGKDVLEQLRAARFLFDSAEAEQEWFEALCRKAWEAYCRDAPRHFTLVVNTRCNFACPYCFEPASERTQGSGLQPAQVDAAFRVMDESAEPHHPPEVEVFGGEPLLPGSRRVLERILTHLETRRGYASVQTNGYHLQAYLDLFERYGERIRQLQVTLDGPRPVHDHRRARLGGRPTFDRIVAGVNGFARLNLPAEVSIRMNVDRDNVDALPDMPALYAEQGWSGDPRFRFVAAPVDNRSGVLADERRLLPWHELFARLLPLSRDTGGGPFDLSVFKAASYFRNYLGRAAGQGRRPATFQPRVNYCEAAALKLFVFHPDGRIYPCPETVGQPDFAIGTYDPDFSLDEAACAGWSEQTILTRQGCRECPLSTFCGGGCILAARQRNGSTQVPECENCSEVIEALFAQYRRVG